MRDVIPRQADTAVITFTISNPRPVESRTLFALVDIEVHIAGISLLIQGVQARRLPAGGTSIHLPTYRDADGSWRPAIRLPEEVQGPLTDAVLGFLVEAGLARPKFKPLAEAELPGMPRPG